VRAGAAWRGAMATQALELHPPIQPSEFILHTCPSAAAWPGEEVALKGNPRGKTWGGEGLRYQYRVPGMLTEAHGISDYKILCVSAPLRFNLRQRARAGAGLLESKMCPPLFYLIPPFSPSSHSRVTRTAPARNDRDIIHSRLWGKLSIIAHCTMGTRVLPHLVLPVW
jgi:hypothetical protein